MSESANSLIFQDGGGRGRGGSWCRPQQPLVELLRFTTTQDESSGGSSAGTPSGMAIP